MQTKANGTGCGEHNGDDKFVIKELGARDGPVAQGNRIANRLFDGRTDHKGFRPTLWHDSAAFQRAALPQRAGKLVFAIL